MRIRKVNQTTPTQAQVIDSLSGNSTTDAPSIHAVKELNIYSTREIICGYDEVVVNNQTKLVPRYRKKYIDTMNGTSNLSISHGLTNFILRHIEGVERNSNTGSCFNLPSIRPQYNTYTMGVYLTSTNIVVEVALDAPSRTGQEVEVTLEYNKTTDF